MAQMKVAKEADDETINKLRAIESELKAKNTSIENELKEKTKSMQEMTSKVNSLS